MKRKRENWKNCANQVLSRVEREAGLPSHRLLGRGERLVLSAAFCSSSEVEHLVVGEREAALQARALLGLRGRLVVSWVAWWAFFLSQDDCSSS